MSGHEKFDRPDEVKLGSDRSFGLVFAAVFALVGGWQVWRGRDWGWWALTASAAFLTVAMVLPAALNPLNRLWFQFGMLLHRAVNPLILGLLFFGVVMPIGLLMRLLGKRPLNLDHDAQAASYWVRRDPPGPAPETFTKQF